MSKGWDLPWAEPIASDLADAGQPERARLFAAFAASLRRTGSLMQLMGQAAADRMGINATDLNCLNLLSFSGQMTAGQLAKATGLSTASITGVIDRLEEAGFVRRESSSDWSQSARFATSHLCSCLWSGRGSGWQRNTATKS